MLRLFLVGCLILLNKYSYTQELDSKKLELPVISVFNSLDQYKSEKPKENDEKITLILSHIDPQGAGYNSGYTSFGVYSYDPPEGGRLLYQAKLHLFNTLRFGGNLGFGIRSRKQKGDWFGFGSTFHYDFLYRRKVFHQAAIGFQISLGNWSISTNGYISLARKIKVVNRFYQNYPEDYYFEQDWIRNSFNHGDLELGCLFGGKFNREYLGAKIYLLKENCNCEAPVWGGAASWKLNLNDRFMIENFISHDKMFKTRYQIRLSTALYSGSSGRGSLDNLIRFSREDIVPTHARYRWSWNY